MRWATPTTPLTKRRLPDTLPGRGEASNGFAARQSTTARNLGGRYGLAGNNRRGIGIYSPKQHFIDPALIMSKLELANLPSTLRHVDSRPLFAMRLDVLPIVMIGTTPGANRRIGIVPGGEFEGDRMSGVVLDGGADWQSVRADGSTTLDVRLVLKTADNALITMRYQGIRHGPADVIARMEGGEAVDASSYYFRIAPMFETADSRYDFLNRVLAVGVGHRQAGGPVYSIFELL